MAQTTRLLATLKSALKAHGKTYADVSMELGLSEASVKRLFSEESFSLQRLERICRMMGMEISDLVVMMQESGERRIARLTEAQEQTIVEDIELLLMAVCVLNRWTLDDIVDSFDIPGPRCIQRLVSLDRMGLIELLPGNRVRLRIASNFAWRRNGPIQRFFQEKLQRDFFASRFDRKSEHLIVVNGMLSDNANAVFQRKMEKLARDFDELNADDAGLPMERRKGTTVVLAMRPWSYGLFDRLRKK